MKPVRLIERKTPASVSITFGTTDDFGYNIVSDPVHVHDLHATLLHQLGIDHTKLIHRYQGRQFRLTDVGGSVIRDLIA